VELEGKGEGGKERWRGLVERGVFMLTLSGEGGGRTRGGEVASGEKNGIQQKTKREKTKTHHHKQKQNGRLFREKRALKKGLRGGRLLSDTGGNCWRGGPIRSLKEGKGGETFQEKCAAQESKPVWSKCTGGGEILKDCGGGLGRGGGTMKRKVALRKRPVIREMRMQFNVWEKGGL